MASLFNDQATINILPADGDAYYHGPVMDKIAADNYFHLLIKSTQWKNDEVILFGKHITTKRKVAWYGDAGFTYTYSNISRQAMAWTPVLQELKQLIENSCGEQFNSCLLNLYHDGDEGMSWHSDDEPELSRNGTIASLSFGAERKFSFKHKLTKQTVSLMLENGSLLLMKGTTQRHWLHSLPKSKKVKGPRINLTFRSFTAQLP